MNHTTYNPYNSWRYNKKQPEESWVRESTERRNAYDRDYQGNYPLYSVPTRQDRYELPRRHLVQRDNYLQRFELAKEEPTRATRTHASHSPP